MAPLILNLIYTLTCEGSRYMGTYGLKGVILAWGRGDLTVEQAIGQILLLLQELEERIRNAERRLEQHREQARRQR
jgi:hypothetical protein